MLSKGTQQAGVSSHCGGGSKDVTLEVGPEDLVSVPYCSLTSSILLALDSGCALVLPGPHSSLPAPSIRAAG